MEAPVEAIEMRDSLDENTLTSLVLRYFDELPARQREVFELSDIQGLSAPEVAERLGMKKSELTGLLGASPEVVARLSTWEQASVAAEVAWAGGGQ